MASSTGGKVGNMRALFEAKQETSSSPPSRGRSPAGSDIHSIRSGSSRPVSKIRTSFVAVEKSGNMGTILGLRRVSDVQDKPELDVDSRQSVPRSTSNAGRESIAEEKELESKTAADKEDEDAKVQQEIEEKVIPNGESETKDTSGVDSLTSAKGKKAIGHIPAPIKTEAKLKGNAASTKRQSTTPRDVPGKARTEPLKSATTTLRTKPLPNSPQAASVKAKPVVTSSGDSASASASRPRVKYNPISKPESRVSTPRTSLASNGTNENRPFKTRTKSPTKPARLPAAAMASTASSAAKSSTTEKTSSNGSGKSRVSSDSDFLARMMRPTAASASKTHEKPASISGSQKTNAPKPRRSSPVSKKRVTEGITKPLEPAQPYSVGNQSPLLKDESTSEPEKVESKVGNKASVDGAVEADISENKETKQHSDVTTAAASDISTTTKDLEKRTSEDTTRRPDSASSSRVLPNYVNGPAHQKSKEVQKNPVAAIAVVPDVSTDTKTSEKQVQETTSTNLSSAKDAIPAEVNTATGDSVQSVFEDDILNTSHSFISNRDETEEPISHDISIAEDNTEADHDTDNVHKDHDISDNLNESESQPIIRAHEQHIAESAPGDDAPLPETTDKPANVSAEHPVSDVTNISESKIETPNTKHEDNKHVSPAAEEVEPSASTLPVGETSQGSNVKAEDLPDS